MNENFIEPAEEKYFYNLYVNVSLAAICLHSLFIVIFGILNIRLLFYYNIVASFVWVFGYLFYSKGFKKTVMITSLLEIIVFSGISTVLLGWGSGFHYYIFTIIPFLCFYPGIKGFRHLSIFMLVLIYLNFNYFAGTESLLPGDFSINIINYLNIVVVFFLLFWVVQKYWYSVYRIGKALAENNKRLKEMAQKDSLTGLLNRRSILNYIENLSEIYYRSGQSLAFIMCDIDDFKEINDTYGHNCGDEILKTVSDIIKNTLRKTDRVARWGGEEFLILLPGTDVFEAHSVGQKLKELISGYDFVYKEKEISLTMTFGVSAFHGDVHEAIERADQAMYKGKEQGKNCVYVNIKSREIMRT